VNRRAFLAFMGAGALTSLARRSAHASAFDTFTPIAPSTEDTVVVPSGFRVQTVIAWGDRLRASDRFGYNPDFTAFFPLPGPGEGLLWANHEYVNLPERGIGPGVWSQTFPLVIGRASTVDDMRHDMGGSVVHLRSRAGGWEVVPESRYARRVTAGAGERMVADGPAVADVFERHDIDGLRGEIQGMLSNCSGGQTPWGTVLTCEENVNFWVADDVDAAGRGQMDGRFWKALGTKYGWVVEIDPYTPAAPPVKHTALGRFRHENVGLRASAGARVACYMGDDRAHGHVFKFVSRDRYRAGDAHRAANQQLLSAGTLFAARFSRDGTGRWIPLAPDTPLAPNGGVTQTLPPGAKTLGQVYASAGAIVVDAFRAANAVGATPTGRPEDLEVHPVTSSVYVAFTSYVSASDPLFSTRLGEIWRLEEDGNDPEAATFKWSRFVASGGVPGQGGFAQPDNLMFDDAANLWVCTDMTTGNLNNDAMPEGAYRNNGVFVIATAPGHREAGKPRQFASGPCESELTGPSLTPDGTTLFLSVQHPGERFGIRGINDVASPRGSNWPAGTPGAPPRPAIVAITRA
jgi:secreted PhoX family phosphatase